MQPIKQNLNAATMKKFMLDEIRDSKIPFYDKLPEDYEYRIHHLNALYTDKIKDAAEEKAKEDQNMLQLISEQL